MRRRRRKTNGAGGRPPAPRDVRYASSAVVFHFPVADLLAGLLLGDAVGALDAADQDVATALDRGQVVVGQLAPLLLDVALGHVPVALDLLPGRVGLAGGRGGRGLGGRRVDDRRRGDGEGQRAERREGEDLSHRELRCWAPGGRRGNAGGTRPLLWRNASGTGRFLRRYAERVARGAREARL